MLELDIAKETEVKNIVQFPKRHVEQTNDDVSQLEEKVDILEELIEEFKGIDLEQLENEAQAYLNAEQDTEQQSTAIDLLASIKKKMNGLKENNQRLKFYLDEIESAVKSSK